MIAFLAAWSLLSSGSKPLDAPTPLQVQTSCAFGLPVKTSGACLYTPPQCMHKSQKITRSFNRPLPWMAVWCLPPPSNQLLSSGQHRGSWLSGRFSTKFALPKKTGQTAKGMKASQSAPKCLFTRLQYEDLSSQSDNHHVLKTHIDALRLRNSFVSNKERAHP